MSSKTRLLILMISTPLVLFVGVGGLLGASAPPPAGQQAFADLRLFGQIVQLITSSYVEPVDVDKVMDGAMRGLADGLDPSSAYLLPEEKDAIEAGTPLPPAGVGLVVTRQFYIRVVGVEDGSPAAKAGLRTGDFLRAIDTKPTRDMSALTGTRLLRGAPGSSVKLLVLRGNAADPHEVTLTRVASSTTTAVTSKKLPGGETYVRVARFTRDVPAALKQIAETAQKDGSSGLVIDLRGTADGAPVDGVAAAQNLRQERHDRDARRTGQQDRHDGGPDRRRGDAADGARSSRTGRPTRPRCSRPPSRATRARRSSASPPRASPRPSGW